jgi:hypothetical protein
VENDLKGFGISSQNDEISNSSVETLGGLVSSLLELSIVGSLVQQVH